MTERSPDKRTRASDERWDRRLRHWFRTRLSPLLRENWYRDVWLLIASVLILLSISGQNNVLDDVQQVQEDQREGRRAAVQVVCAATSAVIDAGRATIIGGAESLDPEFTAALERLGYPPIEVRREQAQKAAKLYAQSIAAKVEKATGFVGIVNEKKGTLDCVKLAELSKVAPKEEP